MKNRIYEYIKQHGWVAVHNVSDALNISGSDALRLIEELRACGYLRAGSPVPLSLTNGNSCFYTITDKDYYDV